MKINILPITSFLSKLSKAQFNYHMKYYVSELLGCWLVWQSIQDVTHMINTGTRSSGVRPACTAFPYFKEGNTKIIKITNHLEEFNMIKDSHNSGTSWFVITTIYSCTKMKYHFLASKLSMWLYEIKSYCHDKSIYSCQMMSKKIYQSRQLHVHNFIWWNMWTHSILKIYILAYETHSFSDQSPLLFIFSTWQSVFQQRCKYTIQLWLLGLKDMLVIKWKFQRCKFFG